MPNVFTAITARGRQLAIAAQQSLWLRFQLRGSISTGTGVPPQARTALASATQQYAGTTTESEDPTPSAPSDKRKAEKPDATHTACSTPPMRESTTSSSCTLGPCAQCPLRAV